MEALDVSGTGRVNKLVPELRITPEVGEFLVFDLAGDLIGAVKVFADGIPFDGISVSQTCGEILGRLERKRFFLDRRIDEFFEQSESLGMVCIFVHVDEATDHLFKGIGIRVQITGV